MSDAMQVAQQRRAGYQKAIAQKETEIAELKEFIEDLDNFLEFGQSLLGKDPAEAARPVSRPVNPVQQPQQQNAQKAEDDDDWGEEEPQKTSIARVLSTRTG
ncbi:MAG: hypothetical protein HKN27_17240 [Silicimonas sp.]|nr:hypothetical protein [Silicimonas sp.]